MKLYIVILCYRVPDLTIDCLRSLSSEIGKVPGAKVGLLENGSGGDCAERLRQAIRENGWGSWVELTTVLVNLGFTGGNNLLIRDAFQSADPPEYVLLLNSDTIVWEHALDALVDFMDSHPRAGTAGSRMLNPDGNVRASPFRFPGVLTEFDRGLRLGIVSKLMSRWAIEPPKPQQPTKVDWVSGASMILRRTMLEEIGLLDEGLFTYFDDADLGIRTKRAGWETWYVTQSPVVHLGGASTGLTAKAVARRPAYWYQARRRFFLKNYGKIRTALADVAFITGYALWRLRRIIERKAVRDPEYMLLDSIHQSVFWAGFRLNTVENPALKEANPSTESSGKSVGASA